MSSEVVRHAWSVLCDRAFIDRDTNNVSVDAIEQLNFPLPEIPKGARGLLLPYPVELVSLWYRLPTDKPAKQRARLRLEDPQHQGVGLSEMEVDLTTATRHRTRVRMPLVPVTGPGVYYFVVEQERGDGWKEVARVPLEVANVRQASPAAVLQPGAAEPSARYGTARKGRSTKRRLRTR
jgi:hypothetical protein